MLSKRGNVVASRSLTHGHFRPPSPVCPSGSPRRWSTSHVLRKVEVVSSVGHQRVEYRPPPPGDKSLVEGLDFKDNSSGTSFPSSGHLSSHHIGNDTVCVQLQLPLPHTSVSRFHSTGDLTWKVRSSSVNRPLLSLQLIHYKLNLLFSPLLSKPHSPLSSRLQFPSSNLPFCPSLTLPTTLFLLSVGRTHLLWTGTPQDR